MKKNKEWFMEQMKSMTRMRDLDSKPESWYISEGALLEALNELDEPKPVEQTIHLLESVLKENKLLGELLEEKHEEWLDLMGKINNQETLSQEWVDNESMSMVDTFNRHVLAVPIYKLENLLVPKQELPVIPDYVADWLDDNIERYKTVYSFIISLVEVFGNTVPEEVWTYASENPDTMARAYLDGYTVEEEQKYYVVNNDNRMMLVRMMDGKTITEADPFKLEDMYEVEKKAHRLTEKEIKDYDHRYWAFAVSVEEMEE